jgi:hypothetical protein
MGDAALRVAGGSSGWQVILTQRETGDRMIGWGFMFRSRVSAVVSLVRVFRCGKIPNPYLVLKT